MEAAAGAAKAAVDEAAKAGGSFDLWRKAAETRIGVGATSAAGAQSNSCPSEYNIGTPVSPTEDEPSMVNFAAYKAKDIYEEKYAANPLHMYDAKNPEDWCTTTRDYLIGRTPSCRPCSSGPRTKATPRLRHLKLHDYARSSV